MKAAPFPGVGRSVAEQLTQLVATIGENMTLRRARVLSVPKGVVATYVHQPLRAGLGRSASWWRSRRRTSSEALEMLGRQMGMQIAASRPEAVDIAGIDPAALEREKAIFREQARGSGKPDAIIEKMVEGRIRKFYEEVVLLEQVWVHDGETRVKAVLAKSGARVADFARFTLGEGIDKPQGPDFASEVAGRRGGRRRRRYINQGDYQPLSRQKHSQLLAHGLAEIPQRVERVAAHEFMQFLHRLVRRKVGVSRGPDNFIGAFNNLPRRNNPHHTHHGVETHDILNLRFVVHQGMRHTSSITSSIKSLIKVFSLRPVMREQACPGLGALAQPGGNTGCQFRRRPIRPAPKPPKYTRYPCCEHPPGRFRCLCGTPGMSILSLALQEVRWHTTWFGFNLREDRMGRISIGSSLSISLPNAAGRMPGTVTRIPQLG